MLDVNKAATALRQMLFAMFERNHTKELTLWLSEDGSLIISDRQIVDALPLYTVHGWVSPCVTASDYLSDAELEDYYLQLERFERNLSHLYSQRDYLKQLDIGRYIVFVEEKQMLLQREVDRHVLAAMNKLPQAAGWFSALFALRPRS